jgi:polysaccharide biosynthesis/export protein
MFKRVTAVWFLLATVICGYLQANHLVSQAEENGTISSSRSNPLKGDRHTPGSTYTLGPRDVLTIRVLHIDELNGALYPVDLQGFLELPRLGRVHAAGLTIDQLERELAEKASEYLQNPIVSVTVAEFHSQPVSVLGAVRNPGIVQVQGYKTLYEVISESGGLREDAGNTITITRRIEEGPLPFANSTVDSHAGFSVAQIDVQSVMTAKDPSDNIAVRANDVITVPKAELVYVIGCVKRPGGFPLQEHSSMSVLEALSLAEGLDHTAATSNSKILRLDKSTNGRKEIPIDVKKILAGSDKDTQLVANDILFIPTSTGKAAALRALDTLIQTGSGVVVYGRPF